MENTTLDLTGLNEAIGLIKEEIGRVIVGQEKMVELLLAAILSDGHVLLEGVPGVAKTLTAKLLACTLDIPFMRIQFTPDLMPSDVIGTTVFNQQNTTFEFRKGPVFSNIVLIDEINRAPAKTQASLFEAMEERQITVDGHTYPMSEPFLVIATQNPVEQEGTYRLPEAQLDRFLFKIKVGYPTLDEEVRILERAQEGLTTNYREDIHKIMTAAQLNAFRQEVRKIKIEDKVLRFIATLVNGTRENGSLYLGASPRASVAILNSSKAIAAMQGRDFVIPDDVLYVVKPVLAHRIELTPEREMDGSSPENIIDEIINKTEVPR